mgnify:CR=1 FL=1
MFDRVDGKVAKEIKTDIEESKTVYVVSGIDDNDGINSVSKNK